MGLIVSEEIPYSGVAISQQNTPIGAILPFMGKEAPSSFLACNGGVYNITQYPKLADFFKSQFGSYNYFGGNGTTTFAVPDLKGEFLRGSGTNTHGNQGSGGEVGEHQDGTEHIGIYGYMGDYLGIYLTEGMDKGFSVTQKMDSTVVGEAFYQQANTITYEQSEQSALFTSRPTNTSVLYIIKAKDDRLDVLDLANSANYSLEEHRVGTWIDGKPLYERIIYGNLPTVTNGVYGIDVIETIPNIIMRRMEAMTCPDGNSNQILNWAYDKYTVDFYFLNNNLCLRSNFSGWNNWKVQIIIQYTKTTD